VGVALEYEVEACPTCASDAAVLYERVRDADGRITAQRRERVNCPECGAERREVGSSC